MKALAGARYDLHQAIERVPKTRLLHCTRCGVWLVVSQDDVDMVIASGIAKNNNFITWVKEFIHCCNIPRLKWVEKTARIIAVIDEPKGGD